MYDGRKDTVPVEEIQAMEEKRDVENVNGQQTQASKTVDDKVVKDVEQEKAVNKAKDEPVIMDAGVPPSATNGDALEADKNMVEEGTLKDIEAETGPLAGATTVPKEDDPTSKHEEKHDVAVTFEVTVEKSSVGGLSIQNGKIEELDWLETQIAVPALTAEMTPSAVEEEMAIESNFEVNFAEEIQTSRSLIF